MATIAKRVRRKAKNLPDEDLPPPPSVLNVYTEEELKSAPIPALQRAHQQAVKERQLHKYDLGPMTDERKRDPLLVTVGFSQLDRQPELDALGDTDLQMKQSRQHKENADRILMSYSMNN
jgi:hypothetical protein